MTYIKTIIGQITRCSYSLKLLRVNDDDNNRNDDHSFNLNHMIIIDAGWRERNRSSVIDSPQREKDFAFQVQFLPSLFLFLDSLSFFCLVLDIAYGGS